MHYYLIINEGTNNGLVNSQVLDPILYNSQEKEVGVISIEKPGARGKLKEGLNIRRLRFAIPYRLFLFNKLAFIFVPFAAFIYALIISFFVEEDDILIARSYFPGLVLLYLKKIKGNKYKFDPRSLFIQECYTKKALSSGSLTSRKWLLWERKIVENAERIVVVAKAQGEYYRTLTSKALDLAYIPCYSSVEIRSGVPSAKATLPFSKDDIVICYYGSLDNGWNNMNVYDNVFRKAIAKGYKICVISQNFRTLQRDRRFNDNSIFILDTENSTNLKDYLRICDYGIIMMTKSDDWETRLGVKFVEYLSCGLGVLVGEFVGEALRISKEHFQLFSYFLEERNDNFPDLEKISSSDRKKIAATAEKLFSPSNFIKIIQ